MSARDSMLTAAAVAAAVAAVAACGSGGSRADTAAAADSAVQAARAEVDSSVPLPDTLTPTQPAGGAPSPAGTESPGGDRKAPTPAAKPGAASPAPTPARTGSQGASDTLRGKPAVVGSSPFTQVALRPAAGGSVTITGPLAAEIGRASGADVWVRGRRSDRGLEASAYRVRSVDGAAALDGVLVVEGDEVSLRLADGKRRALRGVPAALRDQAGARVWVTGGVDQPVAAFGILRPAP